MAGTVPVSRAATAIRRRWTLRSAIIALLLLLCMLPVMGSACAGGGGEPTPEPSSILTPTPVPDPTPPMLGGGNALPRSYQYTRTWFDGEETIVMHVWVKGEKSRADWSLYEPPPGKNEKIKFIDDGVHKWVYEVDEQWAAKHQRNDVVHQVEEHMLWFAENYFGDVSEEAIISEMRIGCSLDRSCRDVAITGHEAICGQACTEYTYTANDGAVIVYWISDTGCLVKVKSVDASGHTVTMDYTDVELAPSIPDDTFDMEKVAPGAVIMDMTSAS